MKASEKQTLCKKLVGVLKKQYKSPLPKTDRPVLDLILYGICLENVTEEDAAVAFDRLFADFHDYNEMRVSSLMELEASFNGSADSEFRALRVKTALTDIFEKYFSFDFEIIRRKTLDAATKQISKLRHLSDFVRKYILQTALGAHVVPVDDRMLAAATWLGLVPPGSSQEEASDALKPALRKADVPLFCHQLRLLSCDPKLIKSFESAVSKPPEEGFDPETAVDRLGDLLSGKSKTANKSASKPARKTAKKKTVKKKTTKKPAAKAKTKKKTTKKTKRTASSR